MLQYFRMRLIYIDFYHFPIIFQDFFSYRQSDALLFILRASNFICESFAIVRLTPITDNSIFLESNESFSYSMFWTRSHVKIAGVNPKNIIYK